jgi:hypothetical protein
VRRPVRKRRWVAVLGLFVAAVAGCVACGGQAAPSGGSPAGSDPPPGSSVPAESMSTIGSAPVGPPAPSSGWHVDLADGFNAPLGARPGEDNIWWPSQSWNDVPADNVNGNNGYETEVFNSSEVKVDDGELVLSARYQPDVAPAAGRWVRRNYVAGIVTSPTGRPGYRGFNWTPGDGSTWAFEIVCRFPPAVAGRFVAFWSSSQGTWVDERDFIELKASILDTDWIYRTPGNGGHLSNYYATRPTFDPAAGMHRYTYVIHPDQSWSLYVDGVLQTWVGDRGVAPPQSSTDTPMDVIMDYALGAASFTQGSSSFVVDSVAVYQDRAHAGRPGVTGGGIAPGTTVAAPAATSK